MKRRAAAIAAGTMHRFNASFIPISSRQWMQLNQLLGDRTFVHQFGMILTSNLKHHEKENRLFVCAQRVLTARGCPLRLNPKAFLKRMEDYNKKLKKKFESQLLQVVVEDAQVREDIVEALQYEEDQVYDVLIEYFKIHDIPMGKFMIKFMLSAPENQSILEQLQPEGSESDHIHEHFHHTRHVLKIHSLSFCEAGCEEDLKVPQSRQGLIRNQRIIPKKSIHNHQSERVHFDGSPQVIFFRHTDKVENLLRPESLV